MVVSAGYLIVPFEFLFKPFGVERAGVVLRALRDVEGLLFVGVGD